MSKNPIPMTQEQACACADRILLGDHVSDAIISVIPLVALNGFVVINEDLIGEVLVDRARNPELSVLDATRLLRCGGRRARAALFHNPSWSLLLLESPELADEAKQWAMLAESVTK